MAKLFNKNIPVVSNFESPRTGKPVANQFLIRIGDMEVFQSYQSIIAVKYKGKVYLDKHYWDYSVTTGKYRNDFLNELKAETQAKIDSGEYKLKDLNR